MKKLTVMTAAMLLLLGLSMNAQARVGDLNVSFSIGQGYKYVDGGLKQNYSESGASPLEFELMGGYEVVDGITLDVGFMFGFEHREDGTGKRAKYLGARPGVHLYLGAGRRPHRRKGMLRPYIRFAFPLDYNTSAKTLNVGLIVGGGFEYRWKHVGLFGEVTVAPFFTNFYMPIDIRIGVAAHF